MVTLSESLHTSRRSILAGSFLTPARNIQLSSVNKKGTFVLKYACHTFADTKICTAAMLLPQAQGKAVQAQAEVKPPTSHSSDAKDSQKPTSLTQTTAPQILAPAAPSRPAFVYELVLCFKENPKAYFLVPRDAILETLSPTVLRFHFLTLRQADKSSPLQQQSITLELLHASAQVLAYLRGHVREQNEVRSKLTSAILHIQKMPLVKLEYDDPKRPPARQVAITMFKDTSAEPSTQVGVDSVQEARVPAGKSRTLKRRSLGTARSKAGLASEAAPSPARKKSKSLEEWRCDVCMTSSRAARPASKKKALVCDTCGTKLRALLPSNMQVDQSIGAQTPKVSSDVRILQSENVSGLGDTNAPVAPATG
ncbi:hypothetical protein BCR37DRAFT_375697 [Protomyces lactucae-debilis]|uniref:Uncharacterized protein n=1 Tax=Protomyces lactucae-debilis TaxID=2754530 RepID=A0A1Y2FUW5_PROLT|nr:uncharacterized protein BCR37DRAFT_375697 [Protomyces lactucae-debilis]ORY87801.1 hypothetical protein BCR37DRAFT_375697 [Protomyces lactucae-debilis]